jgi:hypothetical protein
MHEPGVNGKRPEIRVDHSEKPGILRRPRIGIGRTSFRCAIFEAIPPVASGQPVLG